MKVHYHQTRRHAAQTSEATTALSKEHADIMSVGGSCMCPSGDSVSGNVQKEQQKPEFH